MQKFKNFFVYLPFSLLFGLIPYRILGIFQADYSTRLIIGILFFILFFYQMKNLVVKILNNPVIQLLFFYLLTFENFIYLMSPFFRYLFLFSFFFNIGAWPNQTEDPLFWYVFAIFLFTFYRQMLAIFVNPEFDGSLYSIKTVRKEDDLKWDFIVINMSSICLLFFGKPIQNQLGQILSQRSFGQLSKRYVFTSRFFASVKTHPELATAIISSLGAGVGFGISEYRNSIRHSELLEQQRQANQIQNQLADEAKRANDLKERELLLQLPKPLNENIKNVSGMDSLFVPMISTKDIFFL